jgi:hypothetical protein
VPDPDKPDVRTNCISAVRVDELLADTDLTNDGAADKVLLALNAEEPTKAYVPDNVLLELNDAVRMNDGAAVSVDEPLRLAAPVVVVDGAASLAAIKATVI